MNMNMIKLLIKIIRGLSVVTVIGVVSMGFVMPISISQALVVNPILLMILMGIFVSCDFQLKANQTA
jgi:hypothetical protein